MKALLKILLGALVVFQVVAILQEWPLFAAAWLGVGPGAAKPVALTAEQRQGAEGALRQFHALSRHLYASGADPRFTDRLPASERVAEELLADIAYLQHRGLTQESNLVRLDVLNARALDEHSVVLDTREYWVVRVLRTGDRQLLEPPHSQRFDGTYLMKRQGQAWRVERWDLGAPPTDSADGGG